jgi:signal transduction histidine kinase/ActR/RegA family two-component response regulator
MALFLIAILIQWTLLSIIAAVGLWKAGDGLATLTRRRMRLMSIATCGLNVAILGSASSPDGGANVVVRALALLSAVAFYVGLAPPRFVREMWQRPERAKIQAAVQQLMQTTASDEVSRILLSHAVDIVGAKAAWLMDGDESVMASSDPDLPAPAMAEAGSLSDQGYLRINVGGQTTLLVSSALDSRYFGFEEETLLGTVGTLSAFSFERTRLIEKQLRDHGALRRANAELASANEGLENEIAERRRVEEELHAARDDADRANRGKSDFLSRMSHELRTPLNSILGFGQLLEMEGLLPGQQESVVQIQKAGRHLLDLINEVLDMARIEAGRLSMSIEPVPVADLAKECVSLIKPLASQREISVGFDIAATNGLHALADRQRLKQVVLNLLSNALKYNRRGGHIEVGCDRSVEGTIDIFVSDTGPGISDANLQRLFTAFDRLGVLDEHEEGAGLGLALSNGLVRAMGGVLDVSSEVGVGSRFTARLPAAEPPAEPLREEIPMISADGDGYGRRTIVCIEDNAANVRLLERILVHRPQVTLASTGQGEHGLALAFDLRPDLVLLDVNLPDINGDVVLSRLKGDPATADIPVVFLSADATERQITRLMDAGAAAYVTKPLDVRDFLTTIDRFLDGEGELERK